MPLTNTQTLADIANHALQEMQARGVKVRVTDNFESKLISVVFWIKMNGMVCQVGRTFSGHELDNDVVGFHHLKVVLKGAVDFLLKARDEADTFKEVREWCEEMVS